MLYTAYGLKYRYHHDSVNEPRKKRTVIALISNILKDATDDTKTYFYYELAYPFPNNAYSTNAFFALRNYMLEEYLLKTKIQTQHRHATFSFPNNYTLLIGNGNSISFSSEFKNENIIKRLMNSNNTLARQLSILKELFDYLVKHYFTRKGIINFLENETTTNTPDTCIRLTRDSNYYMLLFMPFKRQIQEGKTIEIRDIGIEAFPLLMRTYNKLKEINDFEFNVSMEYENQDDFVDDLKTELRRIIRVIEPNITNDRFSVQQDFSSIVAFTTNYDRILEKYWNLREVVHLHGTIDDESNIVFGAEYTDKSKSIDKSVIEKLKSITGTLVIHGYSGNFNDEHINKTIRENQNLEHVIYIKHKLYDKDGQLKINRSERSRLLNFFSMHHDNKTITIYDSSLFYKVLYDFGNKASTSDDTSFS